MKEGKNLSNRVNDIHRRRSGTVGIFSSIMGYQLLHLCRPNNFFITVDMNLVFINEIKSRFNMQLIVFLIFLRLFSLKAILAAVCLLIFVPAKDDVQTSLKVS